jgi:hypothetical protein
MFFFEKRTKKLLDIGSRDVANDVFPFSGAFCFFFSKKNSFLSPFHDATPKRLRSSARLTIVCG